MPERPDYDVSAEDYRELVDGENAAAAKPTMVEVVGPLTVREFPARSWSGGQAAVDETRPQQVAGGLPQRTRLAVYNLGPNNVYLASSSESCTSSSAFVLEPAGLPVVFEHTAPVYAVCAAGETATVSTFAEFRDA